MIFKSLDKTVYFYRQLWLFLNPCLICIKYLNGEHSQPFRSFNFLLTERGLVYFDQIATFPDIGRLLFRGRVLVLKENLGTTPLGLILYQGRVMIDREHDEDDLQVEECSVCGGDIIIDEYCEEDDVVYCNDCEAEYLIRSLDPIRLQLLDDDESDDGEDDYDEEYED